VSRYAAVLLLLLSWPAIAEVHLDYTFSQWEKLQDRSPPTGLCSKHGSEHKMTYSQWSAGFRLTRTSARTVTNSIVNKATSADAAWISPVHQT
jgi:hypothetical protein